MALISSLLVPAPGPDSSPPHHPSNRRIVKRALGFSEASSSSSRCDSEPFSLSSVNSYSSSVLFPRRAFMSLSLSLVTGGRGQYRHAQAVVSEDNVGLVNGQLRSCDGGTPCVSTSAFRSPSRFMPPWSYLYSKESAYGELLKALKRMGAQIIESDDDKYIYATMTWSSDEDDVDDLEFQFVDNQVCYRSRSRKTVADPPFCWWPGCINGPRNRGRMETLRDELGWIYMETDEEKVWVPLFLH